MNAIIPGSPAPNRVCTLAHIDIPIIQAPMTYIAGAQLAAAVSNAGALGIIETTSDQGRADLRRVRDLTDGSVGANIALLFNRDPGMVDLLVANGIRFVTTSAGDPALFTARLHDAGITVFHVAGTLAAAKKAVDAGVDGLVVEGVEGGGFKNRFGASTMVLLPLVAAHVDVPIVAAGGSATPGRWPRRLSSVPKACRWARDCSRRRTRRCTATLKEAVVRADETSTVLLPLDGKRMMRVIRTAAAEKINASASFDEGGAALQRIQRLYFDGHGRQRREYRPGGRADRRPSAGRRHHQADVDRVPRAAGRHRGSAWAGKLARVERAQSYVCDGVSTCKHARSRLSAQGRQRRVVIGLLRDFRHQLRVRDIAVSANHHDARASSPAIGPSAIVTP